MPLFGRRSRSVSVSRPTTPSNNSPAMLAASQAFLHNQGPQTKLATGAAAAALRSMSPTTTSVGQVQTKRMMERETSVGTQNAQRGRSRGNNGNLVRRSSSSSMAERTFREPSPGRPASAAAVASGREFHPPVPRLPDNFQNIPPVPKKSQRRSASIDETQIRKGAAIRQSANVNRSSVAGLPAPALKAVNPGLAAARRVTSGPTLPQLDRTDSNNSVNFSYPGRARPTSPPPQKQSFDAAEQLTPQNSTPKGISQAEARNVQYEVAQASQQPVKRTKKRAGPLVEGSHLQSGTMGQKPQVTPLAPGPVPQESHAEQELDQDPNRAHLAGQGSHFPPAPVSPTDSQGSASDSDMTRTRRANRASGALHKQPSVVREDWDGEQDTSSPIAPSPTQETFTSTKRQIPEANVSRKIEGSSLKVEQDPSDATTSPQNLATPQPRKPSLSPSRSARFSNRLSSDITQGQKHEPLPRSVSPRKPALKHSASPQVWGIDTGKVRDSSASPSEATDVSADGVSRPKKSAHVKFDTHSAFVGIAAEPVTPDSSTIVSPQNRDKDKKWFGMPKKSQTRVVLSEDSDDEDSMRPRPVLPTFGSVRNGRRNEADSSPSQKIISSPSSSSNSSLSSGVGHATMQTSFSSDHAIGGLISRETQLDDTTKSSPLPPQVTSVEGTGMHSDTESVYSQADDHGITDSNDVPSIAVQPATPGTEEELQHKDNWLVDVPGGFPAAGQGADNEEISKSAYSPSSYHAVTLTQDITGTPSATKHSIYDDAETPHDRMPSIQEEDSDRGSVYSDAAEDLSDIEGDGFGSINAIVRSPIVGPLADEATPSNSPIVLAPRRDVAQDSEGDAPEWNEAGARWKDYAENAKRAALQPAAPITEKSQPAPKPKSSSQGAPKASSPASNVSSLPTPTQSSTSTGSPRVKHTNPPTNMRKSMRSEADVTAARTMRNTTSNSQSTDTTRPIRSSMRNSGVSIPAAVAATPAPQVVGTLQKKNMRTSAPPVQKRAPLPAVNDDSDSDSSFRRRRRARANANGSGGFRRSMRAVEPANAAPAPSTRQAVRSMSPVQRRPFLPTNDQPTMRTTLRGSADKTPTLRGSQDQKRSSSLFGRKEKAKSPTRPMSMGMRSPSRLADAGDEQPARAQPFKSRFGDSGDEEDNLRPVRGIPRRNKDDDSTDLEDSSDDEASKTRKAGKQKNLAISVPASPPPVSERPQSPSSPDGKKKRGFFGRLRKGKDEPASPAGQDVPSLVGNGQSAATNGVTKNAETSALGFRSDAEKDALIRQTQARLEAARGQADSPTPGRLQRRVTPQRIMSDSWPLPPKIPDNITETPDRPFTSDGGVVQARPGIDRTPSSATAATSPTVGGEAIGKSGKKKRFPMLRKAFGLKD